MLDNKKRAVAIGVFDGVHRGHQAVIAAACAFEQAGMIPAAFTFSAGDSPKRMAMLQADSDKLRLLRQLGLRDILSPGFAEFADWDGETFFRKILLEQLNAGAVCCGTDFRFGTHRSCGTKELKELCERFGLVLRLVEPVQYGGEDISSTRIRRLLSEGELSPVTEMLGHPFSFCMTVESGMQLARNLGYPTANQRWPEELVRPAFGVYASRAEVDGVTYRSVTNIGMKPTVVQNGELGLLAETHLLRYEGELYGKELRVELTAFLRPERKFASLAELQTQIRTDAEMAGKVLCQN